MVQRYDIQIFANDIFSNRVGDKYYGVKLKDSAGNYGDSYTIPAGETVYLDVRLRNLGNWYPVWAEGYSEYWEVDEKWRSSYSFTGPIPNSFQVCLRLYFYYRFSKQDSRFEFSDIQPIYIKL